MILDSSHQDTARASVTPWRLSCLPISASGLRQHAGQLEVEAQSTSILIAIFVCSGTDIVAHFKARIYEQCALCILKVAKRREDIDVSGALL